ncbi:tryptophan dimethylallyltransferase-domain-containing protein [Gautieria morchelliformis]|nr:tryptophan dimethylallyltransferase-domain-containing protein [Gautieria morchelliformis]
MHQWQSYRVSPPRTSGYNLHKRIRPRPTSSRLEATATVFHCPVLMAEEHSLTTNLMEFTAFRSPDADFWSQKLHDHFYKMLIAGDYTPTQRQLYADWFSIWTTFLGPRPMIVDGRDTPVVKSFMCDDHGPIELGMVWKHPHKKPLVKFSIEPIPPTSTTGTDVAEVIAYGLNIIDSLHRLSLSRMGHKYPVIMDSGLFIHILEGFGFAKLDGQWKASTSITNIFLACDLSPDCIETKAYAVFRSSLNLTEKLTLLSGAMSGSGREKPWSTVINYLQSKPLDWQARFSPDPTLVAVDCKDCDDARIKVYFRYQFTDIECLVDQLSLGRAIPLSAVYVTSLRQLLLQLAGDDLSAIQASSRGILLYYDLRAHAPFPKVKIYLPVRLLAANDLHATKVFSAHLETHATFLQQDSQVLEDIQNIWDDRDLSRFLGSFTYLCLTSDGHASLYQDPCIFSKHACVRDANVA